MNVSITEATPPIEITPKLIRRFWRKVDMRGDSECWLWKVGKDRLGYGQFMLSGKPRRAHRVAYYLWNIQWFGPEVKLRHSCDARGCCNPNHLLPGTQADNMTDRMAREGYRTVGRKKRTPPCQGGSICLRSDCNPLKGNKTP